MSATFSRTLRSLRAERSHVTTLLLGLVALVFVGWSVWLARGEVAVQEVSGSARLESSAAVHPMAVEREGRVVRIASLRVGQRVEPGDVLFELEATAERLAVAEEGARRADLDRRLAALAVQIRSEERALGAAREAGASAAGEARAWEREARARAERIAGRLTTVEGLVTEGIESREHLRETRGEHATATAVVLAKQRQQRRIDWEGRVQIADREVRLAELRREEAALEGEARVVRTRVERLEHELDLALVRAPVAGTIGEIAEIRVGAVVAPGDVLVRIIPQGELHVVAHFAPTAAGRLASGQPARLRFPGYPWTQYGTVDASVRAVSQEPAGGSLRVELDLDRGRPTSIPLVHSMPTVVEVEVERLSPLTLLLRAAGGWTEGG